ncbi:MAG: LysR family transcriptional regulator [Stappiaceae bacterium]
MNEISNMQLFVRVVHEGSFSSAARSFGITPSSVSRQISQLEDELGGRLFHRTTRKQTLTETGEIYFQHAHRIVADVEEARLAVSRLTDTPSGRLHVTVETDFAVAYIAPILPDFLDRYPKVQVLFSMSTGKLDVVGGAIDLAIRFGHLEDSGLIARKIATSYSLICASPGYLADHGTPSHPTELANHNCLSFRTRPGRNQWRFKQANRSLEVPISGSINANSLTFLRENALAGQGVIMIPSWMVRDDVQQQRLIPILEDFPLVPSSTPINAVFAHNRNLAPKVRAFVEFLAERMKAP